MTDKSTANIKTATISIIVPVFNECESIQPFLDELKPVLQQMDLGYEILFINDGSSDDTIKQLVNASEANAHIRIISLSRNFGKEAALTAGLDKAMGDAVIPIDVDLQDPPALILEFIKYWQDGYDVVYGERRSRDKDSLTKRNTAKVFYRLFNRLSDIDIPETAGDYRLMDKRVVDVIKQLPERSRFMKGIFAWVGFKSIGVPYHRQQRAAGTTKWNYWKLWNFALDGFISFSTIPLRLWVYLGALISLFSVLYGIKIFASTLMFGVDVPGYASLITAILFLGGIQILSLGIIGEYLGRLFMEAKGRPIYIVEGEFKSGKRIVKKTH